MVLFPNANITIFHLDKKTQTYSRININNVNWSSKRNATVSDKGLNIIYSVVISAEMGDYTLAIGDKVVKGEILQDIKRISELDALKPVMIVGLQESELLHSISIECK